MNERWINGYVFNAHFADLFPKEVRPLRLWFGKDVWIESCIVSSGNPDKAVYIDKNGEPIQLLSLPMINPEPAGILLTWED